MADARYPDRWLSDRRIQRLTDRAHRAFVSALAWSVLNRTDGLLEPEDLPLIPGFAVGSEDELVASGLLVENGRAWVIEPYTATQLTKTEAEALEKSREANRVRQARYKANHADQVLSDNNVTSNVSDNVTEGVTAQVRQGKASPYPVVTNGSVITNPPSQEQSLPELGTETEKPSKARGIRLPEDWQPSESVKADLRAKYPNLKLGSVLEEFRDYWLAIPGQRGRKVDWDRTFRNRVREVADLARYQRNGHPIAASTRKQEQIDDIANRLTGRS